MHTRRLDEREESQLEALRCLARRQLESVLSVFVSCLCAPLCVAVHAVQSDVHMDVCILTSVRAFCLVCVYVCVCVFVQTALIGSCCGTLAVLVLERAQLASSCHRIST